MSGTNLRFPMDKNELALAEQAIIEIYRKADDYGKDLILVVTNSIMVSENIDISQELKENKNCLSTGRIIQFNRK